MTAPDDGRHRMYLEVAQAWVTPANLPKRIKDQLVEPGHVTVVATPDDSGGSRIARLVARAENRFGVDVASYIRKNAPDTPELAVYDADTNDLMWN